MSENAQERWGAGAIGIPLLRSASNDQDLDLHLAAVEYTLVSPITIRDKDDIKSAAHWSEHFKPFEHQVRNLITYCRRAPVALIADDVGLGKTISAGLILSELMTRKKVKRALILAPKLLLPQWCEELNDKFRIQAEMASGDTLSFLLKSQVPVVVTTYETARSRMDQIKKSFFDILILDEAHKLRNLHGTATAPQTARAIYSALAERDFKYVVMLTATPIQNRLWDLYSLVDCLAVARGHRNPLGTKEYFAAYFLADSSATARELKPGRREEFRRHLSEYMVRTSRGDSHLVFPERKVNTIGCPAGAAEEALTRLVATTLPKLNALARSSLAEALMSSPTALVSQLRNMAANGTIESEIPEMAARLADESGVGCKLERLRTLVRRVSKDNESAWRVVVFTRRKETQALIGRVLRAEGVQVGFIEGGKGEANQRAIKDLWADPPRINMLVSTDAGAEGVNLQCANIVVNYDLPWNPMVVEQRIGRVQRLASPHKYVSVVNLVVAGSVEEKVVARLLAKLQAISDSFGDVEAILESSSLAEDKLEDTIRELVLKALMGQDVELATAKIQESIARAKDIYDKEKAEVEKNLGALDAMHTAGPALPNLMPVNPRLGSEDFVLAALKANGAELSKTEDGRWLSRLEGRNPTIVTFDENDPDIRDDGLSGFGRRRAELYSEGRPAFERLVGEWSKRDSARVHDFRDTDGVRGREVAFAWATSLGSDVEPISWRPTRAEPRFSGELHVRGSAAVAHDRFERLVSITIPGLGGVVDQASSTVVQGEVDIRKYVPNLEATIQDGVGMDQSILSFCEFYDQRGLEETAKAQGDPRRTESVRLQFQPSLAAEVVAANGRVYEEVSGSIEFSLGDDGPYTASLRIVPYAEAVISEPARESCAVTGRVLPAECLARCEVSGKRVLRSMLLLSARNGRLALREHTRICEATGRQLLVDEVGASDMSGKVVDDKLLYASAVSGKRGLLEEMAGCEFTDAVLTLEEVWWSEVSGKAYRSDEVAVSGVSGRRGHRSEFVRCAVTRDWLLPEESGRSSVSERVVRKDLLIPSEKFPERFGVDGETVICAISERRLLTDEVERSAVSGLSADAALIGHSALTGVPALPNELVTCESSHRALLPTEVGKCDESGLRVCTDLLSKSDLSGRLVQTSLLRYCPETGLRGLESEMARCGASDLLVDPRQLVRCSVTGKQVLRRLTIECPLTQRVLLRAEAVEAHSGRLGHPETARKCIWTGWVLLSDESVRCSKTRVVLSKDQCHVGGYSLAHADLLSSYHASPAAAEPDADLIRGGLKAKALNPGRIWLRRSPQTPMVAFLAEAKSLFGLRKQVVIGFFELQRQELVGEVAPVGEK